MKSRFTVRADGSSATVYGPRGDYANVVRFSDGSVTVFVGRMVRHEGGGPVECDSATDAQDLAGALAEAIRAVIPDARR